MNFKAWNKTCSYMVKSKRSLSSIIVDQMTGNIMGDTFHAYIKGGQEEYILLQSIGINDTEGIEIFADDIMIDDKENEFRFYHVAGGFAIKASYWADDISDLSNTDELVIMPLADLQTRYWLSRNCKIKCSYYELKQN
jgi:hypothetical protein